MKTTPSTLGRSWRTGALFLGAMVTLVLGALVCREATAGPLWDWIWGHDHGPGCCDGWGLPTDDIGGHWYWLRSEDEEKRVVAALYNRYCIRCHGVDGRGVWDIPGIPDFTSVRWQACRSDAQRARIILEGRGAVMPPFRGAITLEEAWALGRYLRTFVPGTEESKPDLSSEKDKDKEKGKNKDSEKDKEKGKGKDKGGSETPELLPPPGPQIPKQ